MDNQLQHLVDRIDKHIAETGASEASLSAKLFGNGVRIRQIRKGSTPTYRIIRSASERMDKIEASAQKAEAEASADH